MAAGVAALCSLGLAWGSGSSSGAYSPGWYTAGTCITVYDADGYASLDCTGGYISPGYYTPGSAGPSGASQPARVFLAIAAAAAVVGYRSRDRRLVLAAPVIMAVGLAVTGLNPGPGMVAYSVGLACLSWGLHLDGALRFSRRTMPNPSPA